MRLTGDAARECLSRVLPPPEGSAPRFAPPGAPPILTLRVGIDPDALAPRLDLRTDTRHAGSVVSLETGPPGRLLQECLSRAGAPEPIRPSLERLAREAFAAFRRLEAIAIRAQAAPAGGEAAFGDCMLWLDDRALVRHPELEDLLPDTLDRRLARAGIDYVGLDGDVGLLCIGAGMTLAMIDRLRDAGVRPAAFLDVSRNPSPDGIALALQTLLDHHHARAIAVNVFGGITPVDHLARSIVEALARAGGPRVPLAVRLEGTGGEEGRAALAAAGIPLAASTAEVVAFAARHGGGGA